MHAYVQPVCMHVCMYACIYMNVGMHICMHTQTCIHAEMHMHACFHALMRSYTHPHANTNTHARMHTRVCTRDTTFSRTHALKQLLWVCAGASVFVCVCVGKICAWTRTKVAKPKSSNWYAIYLWATVIHVYQYTHAYTYKKLVRHILPPWYVYINIHTHTHSHSLFATFFRAGDWVMSCVQLRYLFNSNLFKSPITMFWFFSTVYLAACHLMVYLPVHFPFFSPPAGCPCASVYLCVFMCPYICLVVCVRVRVLIELYVCVRTYLSYEPFIRAPWLIKMCEQVSEMLSVSLFLHPPPPPPHSTHTFTNIQEAEAREFFSQKDTDTHTDTQADIQTRANTSMNEEWGFPR